MLLLRAFSGHVAQCTHPAHHSLATHMAQHAPLVPTLPFRVRTPAPSKSVLGTAFEQIDGGIGGVGGAGGSGGGVGGCGGGGGARLGSSTSGSMHAPLLSVSCVNQLAATGLVSIIASAVSTIDLGPPYLLSPVNHKKKKNEKKKEKRIEKGKEKRMMAERAISYGGLVLGPTLQLPTTRKPHALRKKRGGGRARQQNGHHVRVPFEQGFDLSERPVRGRESLA